MKQIFIMAGMLFFASTHLMARYHSVRSEDELTSLLNKYQYTVVCFAPSGALADQELHRDEKQEIRQTFKDLQNIVKTSAARDQYHRFLNKDIGFLVVDTASKRAHEVSGDYALRTFPSCLVFDSGSLPFKQPLIHPKTSASIIKFLEQAYGDKIKEMLKERKEEDRLRRQERIASYYAYGAYGYPYYGWGWSYPYWGGYYPYYGSWRFGC